MLQGSKQSHDVFAKFLPVRAVADRPHRLRHPCDHINVVSARSGMCEPHGEVQEFRFRCGPEEGAKRSNFVKGRTGLSQENSLARFSSFLGNTLRCRAAKGTLPRCRDLAGRGVRLALAYF